MDQEKSFKILNESFLCRYTGSLAIASIIRASTVFALPTTLLLIWIVPVFALVVFTVRAISAEFAWIPEQSDTTGRTNSQYVVNALGRLSIEMDFSSEKAGFDPREKATLVRVFLN